MQIASVADLSATTAAAANTAPATEAKTAEAVRDFEAILIGQMLKTARESGGGSWLSSEEDAASSPAVEFAEQQLAKTMAASGGLGLATLMAPHIKQPVKPATPHQE